MLSWILGTINTLRPTCLVLAIRHEYDHEDLRRQFQPINLPPMNRIEVMQAIYAWGEIQQPPLDAVDEAALKALVDRILDRFSPDVPCAVPFRLIQLVTNLSNMGLVPELGAEKLLRAYLDSQYDYEVISALVRSAEAMPPADIEPVARASAVEAEPYGWTSRERSLLTKAGLLRPAMARAPDDERVILDPLAAYLANALRK